jgi:hypothetical protein
VGIQTLSADVSDLKTENEQKLNLNLTDPVLEQLSMVRVEIAAMSPTVTHCHPLSPTVTHFISSFIPSLLQSVILLFIHFFLASFLHFFLHFFTA